MLYLYREKVGFRGSRLFLNLLVMPMAKAVLFFLYIFRGTAFLLAKIRPRNADDINGKSEVTGVHADEETISEFEGI